MLTGKTPGNSRTLINWTSFGPQAPDTAWARLGAGGPFWATSPTPTQANILASNVVALVRTNGINRECVFAFPTSRGIHYIVEFTPSLSPPQWTTVRQVEGNGIEQVVTQPLANTGFFRVRTGR